MEHIKRLLINLNIYLIAVLLAISHSLLSSSSFLAPPAGPGTAEKVIALFPDKQKSKMAYKEIHNLRLQYLRESDLKKKSEVIAKLEGIADLLIESSLYSGQAANEAMISISLLVDSESEIGMETACRIITCNKYTCAVLIAKANAANSLWRAYCSRNNKMVLKKLEGTSHVFSEFLINPRIHFENHTSNDRANFAIGKFRIAAFNVLNILLREKILIGAQSLGMIAEKSRDANSIKDAIVMLINEALDKKNPLAVAELKKRRIQINHRIKEISYEDLENYWIITMGSLDELTNNKIFHLNFRPVRDKNSSN
ncbi:MAG: hypothetical protein ABII27_04885 [bacterium]